MTQIDNDDNKVDKLTEQIDDLARVIEAAEIKIVRQQLSLDCAKERRRNLTHQHKRAQRI